MYSSAIWALSTPAPRVGGGEAAAGPLPICAWVSVPQTSLT